MVGSPSRTRSRGSQRSRVPWSRRLIALPAHRGMTLGRDQQHEGHQRERRGRECRRGPDRFAERGPPALELRHPGPELLVALIERTRDVVLVDVQRNTDGRRDHHRAGEQPSTTYPGGRRASHQEQRRIRECDESEPGNETDGRAPVTLDEELRGESTDRDDHEADEASPQDRGVVRRRERIALRHGRLSAARIRLSVSADGLYFARLLFSFANVGSSVGYGRYSWTSVTQRDAFGTPAASNAV